MTGEGYAITCTDCINLISIYGTANAKMQLRPKAPDAQVAGGLVTPQGCPGTPPEEFPQLERSEAVVPMDTQPMVEALGEALGEALARSPVAEVTWTVS